MKNIIIIQTVIPDYRINFFNALKKKYNGSLTLYGGKSYFESSVKSSPDLIIYERARNLYFFNRRFLFQYGFWNAVFGNNVVVMELNPRIISNWIILIIRKVIRRKSVLWGHAWPRKGSDSKTDSLRGIMRRLADKIIVYTKTQKWELLKKMPEAEIFQASNSLYLKRDMKASVVSDHIHHIIYVGRLVEKKKPLLMVKAFHAVMHKIPQRTELLIIGDGNQKEPIHEYIEQHNLGTRIKLLGHIADYDKLRSYYDSSLLSVSPGYVGLSITQSFSFGVPMLISKSEPHAPEIEAARDGENCVFFESDNVQALGLAMVQIIENREEWISKRIDITDFCKEYYSVETMSSNFKAALSV